MYHLDRNGVYQLGEDEPLSRDIEDLFRAPDNDAELMLDPDGVWLYLLYDGSIYVYNTLKGGWGQIDVVAKGLIQTDEGVGWYGQNGLWRMVSRYAPDTDNTGVSTPVASHFAHGRCNRTLTV